MRRRLLHRRSADAVRYSPGGSTSLREMTSWPPSWKCDVKSKIRLLRSMRICLKNIPSKFHSDPIWNDGALGFFEEIAPPRTTRWEAIWNQFLIWKLYRSHFRSNNSQAIVSSYRCRIRWTPEREKEPALSNSWIRGAATDIPATPGIQTVARKQLFISRPAESCLPCRLGYTVG